MKRTMVLCMISSCAMRTRLLIAIISVLFFLLFPSRIWASVQVDGICYDLYPSYMTASVVNGYYEGEEWLEISYSGDINIPASFVYEGNTYSVTGIHEAAFKGNIGLTSVTIPNSVTIIYEDTFEGCTGLTSVTIPNSVTRICLGAFHLCSSLTSVTIPNSVTGIGLFAFYGCTGLTSITCENESPVEISSNVFLDVNKSACTLYVPAGCKSAYENSEGWNEFENIVEIGNSLEVLATGQCGDNLTYTIYTDMTMVISGQGAMRDYSFSTHINNEYYQSIEKVIIEDGVTSIGNFAFRGCTALTSVEIPNGVTSIGGYAFEECSGLASLTIPSSVISITTPAFVGCSGLTSIIVDPGNVIYDSRSGCNAIINSSENRLIVGCKNTIIPSSVTAIGAYAFSDNTGVTSLSIPSSVYEIGYQAFTNCTGLTALSIPSSMAFIYLSAFYGCTSLMSITCESETPASIEGSSFGDVDKSNCILYVPAGCKSVYENAAYWNEFENIVEIGNCTEVLATGPCGDNVTYTIYSDMTMVISGQGAMWDYDYYHINDEYYQSVEKVIIEDGVTSIGSYAFDDCSGLTSVSLPNSLIEIGVGAYYGCTGLITVTIPNGVTCIGISAFSGCTGLTSVTIPASVTDINILAFSGCISLTSITCENEIPVYISKIVFRDVDKSACILYVPRGSKSAYKNADYWSEFTNIVEYGEELDVLATGSCGDNVTYTIYSDMTMVVSGTGEMWGYTNNGNFGLHINDDYYQSIEKVIIEDGVTRIGGSAFRGCTSLTSIDIPNSVTSFGVFAFEDCTSLASIDIPSSVMDLGVTHTFCGCSSLTSITIPNGVGFIGMGLFGSCTGLTFVDIPNSVTAIWEGAFGNCTSLASITIPNSVTTIDRYAFRDCTGLTSVTIPNSLTEIDYRAFSGCTGLTSITCENESPIVISSSLFGDVDKSACTLYVPIGSKSTYENADYWNEFENIVEFGGESDTDISVLDNVIYVEQAAGVIGGTKDISVKMKNDFDVRGFQFTMELPEGATVNSWTLNQDRMPEGTTMNKVLATESIEGNQIIVGCALNDGMKTFTGNDGAIAKVNVTFDEDMEEGTYPIYLTNVSISNASAEHQLVLSDVKTTLVLEDYVVGDTNGDGKILIGDVIAILNYIIGSPSDNFNVKAADVNGDGKILIGDVIAVLNIIVNQ